MLIVFGRSEAFLVEGGAIIAQSPGRHVLGRAGADGNDDVRKERPRVVEIVLRWPCGMIGMRMVEAERLDAQLGGAALGVSIVLRAHQEPAAGPFLGGIW